MNLRLELVTVPVSDVERAKPFYVDPGGFTESKTIASIGHTVREVDATQLAVLDRPLRVGLATLCPAR